jgi:hypothetical protein
MGFGNEKPGSATDLLRCGQSSAARFGRCSEGQVPSRTGIPNRNPEPDFDFDFDFDTGSDNDLSEGQPMPGGDARRIASFQTGSRRIETTGQGLHRPLESAGVQGVVRTRNV